MTDQYEEQKASSGGLATIAFLITGAYLFITGPGMSAAFSLAGIMFFLVGMFVAALIVGMPVYFLQRGLSKALLNSMPDPFSPKSVFVIKGLGVILLLSQVVVTIWFTNLAFHHVIA